MSGAASPGGTRSFDSADGVRRAEYGCTESQQCVSVRHDKAREVFFLAAAWRDNMPLSRSGQLQSASTATKRVTAVWRRGKPHLDGAILLLRVWRTVRIKNAGSGLPFPRRLERVLRIRLSQGHRDSSRGANPIRRERTVRKTGRHRRYGKSVKCQG